MNAAEDQSEKERIRKRLAGIEAEIESAREERKAETMELTKTARELNRKEMNLRNDPELRELHQQVVAAEKKYRKLLEDYNKAKREQPEFKQLEKKREGQIDDIRAARKRRMELEKERAALKQRLNVLEVEKDGGDNQ